MKVLLFLWSFWWLLPVLPIKTGNPSSAANDYFLYFYQGSREAKVSEGPDFLNQVFYFGFINWLEFDIFFPPSNFLCQRSISCQKCIHSQQQQQNMGGDTLKQANAFIHSECRQRQETIREGNSKIRHFLRINEWVVAFDSQGQDGFCNWHNSLIPQATQIANFFSALLIFLNI